tara:strand:+ start:350 stop:748 length:399 start_codon:yes stop_codon:yes gene_type:complete
MVLNYGLSAALTGILCCVAPMILFQLGLVSGIYAISFADFFYNQDGSVGFWGYMIRVMAVIIILIGIYNYNKKQNCSLNSKKEKIINKLLFLFIIISFALITFLSLEEFSSYYFDEFIVPQQQKEFKLNSKV